MSRRPGAERRFGIPWWELVSFVGTLPGGGGDCFVATFKRERLR